MKITYYTYKTSAKLHFFLDICKLFCTFAQKFNLFSNKMTLFDSLDEYIAHHSSAEPPHLQQITRKTYLNVLNPRMCSGHVQGRVLSMLSRMIRPHRILELGTFTGYSALCLAEGLTEDGLLYTIDHNDELSDMVAENLALSPRGQYIHPLVGDACQLMHSMVGSEPFDLIFIDADKREYCAYLEACLPLLRHGGFILADNTLWDGHIIDPAYDRDAQTKGLREFNDKVALDERLEKVILPLRDGLTLIEYR